MADSNGRQGKSHVGENQEFWVRYVFFFIYVNDLPNCPLASDIVLYADDTVLYYSSKDLSDLQRHLNVDLETVSE